MNRFHKSQKPKDELRSEYHFDDSKAVQGKYYRSLVNEGANIVMLNPIGESLPRSAAVSEALRSLLEAAHVTQG